MIHLIHQSISHTHLIHQSISHTHLIHQSINKLDFKQSGADCQWQAVSHAFIWSISKSHLNHPVWSLNLFNTIFKQGQHQYNIQLMLSTHPRQNEEDEKQTATAWALASFLRNSGHSKAHSNILERTPSFVSKDKQRTSKLSFNREKKKVSLVYCGRLVLCKKYFLL